MQALVGALLISWLTLETLPVCSASEMLQKPQRQSAQDVSLLSCCLAAQVLQLESNMQSQADRMLGDLQTTRDPAQ